MPFHYQTKMCKFCISEVKTDKLPCLQLVVRCQYGEMDCGTLVHQADSCLFRDDDNLTVPVDFDRSQDWAGLKG